MTCQAEEGGEKRPLESLKGDEGVRVSEFFGAYAADLPADLALTTIKCGEDFLRRKLRTNLRQLFSLTAADAEAVAIGAGIDKEDAPGWVAAWEDAAGMKFTGHGVPESAKLFAVQAQTSVHKGEAASANYKPRRTVRTIGQQLASENKTLVIPEYCYSWVQDTLDPATTSITEPEVEKFSDSVIEFVGTQYGRYNLGRPLCRRLGAGIARRLPFIPKGKGQHRRWWKILYNKTKNRKNVRLAPPRPPPTELLTI